MESGLEDVGKFFGRRLKSVGEIWESRLEVGKSLRSRSVVSRKSSGSRWEVVGKSLKSFGNNFEVFGKSLGRRWEVVGKSFGGH